MSRQTAPKAPYSNEDEEIEYRINLVKSLGSKMVNEFENEKLHEGVDTAYLIADNLRTTTLTPKNYYSLYLEVQTIFTSLVSSICELKDKSMLKQYERVQYYSHAVPRLYLMCAVGSACITKKKASITDLLKDLVEMSRCIQHPTKGLFLRSYLLYTVKNHLPQNVTASSEEDGTLEDSIQFLLTNFTEMNKLNIRLAQKQKDSQVQLCQLVAMNLSILSNLDYISSEEYKSNILPQILQQIIICGDIQSQTYLIDAVIQAFPAKFQLTTLKPILRTIVTAQKGVDVVKLLRSLIKSLTTYIISEKHDDNDIYPLFDSCISEAMKHEQQNKSSMTELLPEYISLLERWYEEKETFKFVQQLIIKVKEFIGKEANKELSQSIIHFLEATYAKHDILSVVQLDGFAEIIELLDLNSKHIIQRKIIGQFIKENKELKNAEEVQLVMDMTSTIHKDLENCSDDDIKFDSSLSTSLIQSIQIEDAEEMISTLREIKGIISMGCALRRKIALPGLLFKFIGIRPLERKVFVGALDILKTLVKQNEVLLCVRLAIQCTLCGLNNGIDTTSFFEFATSLFESNISNAEEKRQALEYIIGGGCSMKINDEEKFIVLATAVTKYSQIIEDVNSRVNIIALCSALWAKRSGVKYESKQHCSQCLQKSLKEANLSNDNIKLFINVLNRYVALYVNGYIDFNKYIIQLKDLIQSNIGDFSDVSLRKYFQNTCEYISRIGI